MLKSNLQRLFSIFRVIFCFVTSIQCKRATKTFLRPTLMHHPAPLYLRSLWRYANAVIIIIIIIILKTSRSVQFLFSSNTHNHSNVSLSIKGMCCNIVAYYTSRCALKQLSSQSFDYALYASECCIVVHCVQKQMGQFCFLIAVQKINQSRRNLAQYRKW